MAGSVVGVDGRALKKVFSKLVDGLKATDIIDELFEKDLLILDEYTGILEACSQSSTREDSRNVNRRVLTAILRRPPGFVAELVAILRKKDMSLANALENALAEVSGQHQPDPAPSQQFAQDVQPSSSGVTSGPMSKWNVDALVALKGELKLNVKMIALANILETPAGGFMNSAEVQSVRDKTGDAQQIEELSLALIQLHSEETPKQSCLQSWPSQVSSLEEEVAQLKQQLKESEVDREKLSAELWECRKIKVEPGVLVREPLGSMKPRLKEERDEGEEPEHKKLKTEEADTVEAKLESHPQEEKKREERLYEPPPPSIIYERGPQTPSVFPPASPYSSTGQTEMAETVEMELESHSQVGVFPPHVFSGARPPVPQPSSFQQPVLMGPPGSQATQVPPQVGVLPPHVFSGARPPVPQPSAFQPAVPQVPPQVGVSSPYVCGGAIPPYRQLSSIAQPVQTTPLGWQQTQVGAFLPHVSSGATPPVCQVSPLLQPVPPQVGMFPAHVFRGTSQPYPQLSSIAQPVHTYDTTWISTNTESLSAQLQNTLSTFPADEQYQILSLLQSKPIEERKRIAWGLIQNRIQQVRMQAQNRAGIPPSGGEIPPVSGGMPQGGGGMALGGGGGLPNRGVLPGGIGAPQTTHRPWEVRPATSSCMPPP